MYSNSNLSGFSRSLARNSIFLFLASILIACGGGGGSSNKAPVFTSGATPSVPENTTAVTTVTATDASPVTYSITGVTADDALFSIDANSGVLVFLVAPDFEAPGDVGVDNVYNITVAATDGVKVATQNITVTVTDVAGAPVFTSNATPSVAENTTAVITVTAPDDDGDTITFSITGVTADDALFSITAGGVLTFLAAPNFEVPGDVGGNNVYDIEVTADDGNGNLTAQNIAVTVTNINEGSPVITSSAAASVAENATAVLSVTATDVDINDTVTFGITGVTADDALFSLTAGGVLTFAAAPDFETPGDVGGDNIYNITVTADDGNGGLTPQAITVTVTNVNEGSPVFTSSASPSVVENTTAVTTVTATDVDTGDTVTYSITGVTADDGLFSLTTGGVLTFVAAPDFETPGDIGGNNIYNITVTADDGNGGTTPQSIAVTVTDINEVPVFTSGATPSVPENTTAVTTVTTTDGDNDTVTYSITGGTADDALFSITAGGVLTFLAAPDFESPGDIGGDNVYDIEVTADDGDTGVIAQAITVTVTDVDNTPVAVDDSATMIEKRTINIDLANNDTGDVVDLTSIAIVSGPTNSSAFVVNADGTVDYTHNGTNTTSDSFTYTIDDADSGLTSNAATVDITVLQGFNEALFATPTVSDSTATIRNSQTNDGLTGDTNNGWESASTNPGEWIQLDFDSTKTIYRVYLLDLVSLTNQVTSATISFSDGSPSISVGALPDDGLTTSLAEGVEGVDGVNDFYFAPRQVDWIRVTLNSRKGGSTHYGLSEINAYSSLDPGQSSVETETFNSGALDNLWSVNDNCIKGTSNWTADAVTNKYIQDGDCRGFGASDGVERGSYPTLDAINITDMDLRVRLKSDNQAVGGWRHGAIGVVFAYRSLTDYYRLDVSQIEGHTKLWKMVGSTMTELATSPISYVPNNTFNLRVVRKNTGTDTSVIVVYKDDVKVMAVEDTTTPLNNGDYQVGLLCARNENCVFDSMVVLTAPTTPIVGVNIDDDSGAGEHTSGEYFVDTAGSIDVTAVVTDDADITGVEFEVDGDAGSAQVDAVAPYEATFGSLTTGEHTVRVFLRDGGGRISGTDATEELPMVGISGIHLVGLGDSITGGLRDDVSSDDTSGDGRNTSGGYQPILNDLLTADNGGTPITVLNEGNPGETSAEGAGRMAAVLARNPMAQGYLAIYGANDSGIGTLSGAGLSCTGLPAAFTGCDTNYINSFKYYMQVIIKAAVDAGKTIYLAKTLPHTGDVGRNALIVEYNTAIGELVTENSFTYTPPDFHTYFTTNSGTHMYDTLHPNGLGYQEMAKLWCTSLSTAGFTCTP